MNRDILLLLSKVVALLLLTYFCTEGIHWIIVKLDEDTALVAALKDKHTEAAAIQSPKIILIGGSGVMFDYNSDMLSEHFQKPVVNMGLLAPLGVNLILADAERYINPGDTVILSFEYSNNTCEGDLDTQLELLNYVPEDKEFVSLYDSDPYHIFLGEMGHKIKSIQKIPSLFIQPTVADPYSIYFRKAFTPKGDIISHVNNYTHALDLNEAQSTFDFKEQISCMNRFIDKMDKKGVKVYFVHPVVAAGYYQKAEESILGAHKAISSQLRAPVLTTPQECQYPDSLFFDSVFHLKSHARDIHTQKVIEHFVSRAR